LADRRLKCQAQRSEGRELSQAGLDEFNVDNIEALVDNQPVEDENTNDSSVMGEEEAGDEYSCAACGEIFASRSSLEYHERTQQHLKSFTCPDCNLR
jgi:DNA-directed RNA polymerase subunit RPC12/RpoP